MEEKELRNIFSSKRQRLDKTSGKTISGFVNTTFDQFKIWFDKSHYEKGCYYCGTTPEKTLELYDKQRQNIRHDATRGGKRGKRLELDRRNPSLHYDRLDNIVWCCYWCNNAKSNFFSEEEFKTIAVAIGKTLKSIK